MGEQGERETGQFLPHRNHTGFPVSTTVRWFTRDFNPQVRALSQPPEWKGAVDL